MSDNLRAAIHSVVSARIGSRSQASEAEDVASMAEEAAMLASHIETFRDRISPVDRPEPLWIQLRKRRDTTK